MREIVRNLLSVKLILPAVGLLLFVLLLASFSLVQGTPEFTDAGAPGWSRARLMGHASLVSPVALLPNPQGGAHLAWVSGEPPNGQQLDDARVSADGDVQFSRPLSLPDSQPEAPTLFPGPDSALTLFYLARGEDLQPLERALYLARLDDAGNVLETARVSQPQRAVRTYAVTAQAGAVYQVFYSGDDPAPGINRACYTAAARLVACAPGVQQPFGGLDPTATRPAVRADDQGVMHLAWFKQRVATGNGVFRTELYYAVADADGRSRVEPVRVAAFEFASGVDLKPPQIAVDRTHVYIAWVQDKRGGQGDINSQAYYVSFPIGQPAFSDEPHQLSLPDTGKVKYQPRPGNLLTALAPAGGGSSYVNDLQLLSGPQSLGVALLGLQDKGRAPVQVAAFALAQGQNAGFQVVNDSLAPANQPGLALDAGGHLLAVWLDDESADRYAVRYASTDPGLVARWSQFSLRDVAAHASSLVWYELSFLPWIILSVPWLFLPLAVLIVRTVFASDESLASGGTRVALGLAIAVHLAVKALLLPPLPGDWSPLARLAIMAALPALGLAAMTLYLRRERYASPIVAYLVFAAVDVCLALFVWWPVANA